MHPDEFVSDRGPVSGAPGLPGNDPHRLIAGAAFVPVEPRFTQPADHAGVGVTTAGR